MKIQSVATFLTDAKIVAVVRKLPEASLENVAAALIDGGIRAIEVTLDSEGALGWIETLSARYGTQTAIGAGTILTGEQLAAAMGAGADFLVCPHLDMELMKMARNAGYSLIPGAMTPTEVHRAITGGAEVVKIFPAASLGASYIKDLLGPFGTLRPMVTGGVTADNVASFFAAGAMAAGMGSSLFPRADIDSKSWNAIAHRAKRILSLVSD